MSNKSEAKSKAERDSKDNIDKCDTAPQPSRRKSHGATQINYTLPHLATVKLISASNSSKSTSAKPDTCLKGKGHWRSPSNPIDFMNCIRIKADGGESVSLESVEEITLLSSLDNMLKTTSTTLTPATTPQLPPQQNIVQLNFHTGTPPRASPCGEMTVTKRVKSPTRHCSSSQALQSYENLLLRKPTPAPSTSNFSFQMLAELSISPVVSPGSSSDYTSTRRHAFKFDSVYAHIPADTLSSTFSATSLAHGHLIPPSKVSFSRCCLLQLILRNPQDNSVAGIFVVKLDLLDMPPDSKTILRQKAYKSKCLLDTKSDNNCDTADDYLAKFIEIPLTRSYDPEANRQRILLSGPIRLAFSFNRSNLRYTSPRRSDASAVEPVQKTRTILQFPSSNQKYFPLGVSRVNGISGMNGISMSSNSSSNTQSNTRSNTRSNSLRPEYLGTDRTFQHGSIM